MDPTEVTVRFGGQTYGRNDIIIPVPMIKYQNPNFLTVAFLFSSPTNATNLFMAVAYPSDWRYELSLQLFYEFLVLVLVRFYFLEPASLSSYVQQRCFCYVAHGLVRRRRLRRLEAWPVQAFYFSEALLRCLWWWSVLSPPSSLGQILWFLRFFFS